MLSSHDGIFKLISVISISDTKRKLLYECLIIGNSTEKLKQNKHSYPEENKNTDIEACINNNQPHNLLNMVLKMMRLEKICL